MAKRTKGYWERYYQEHRERLHARQKERTRNASEEERGKRRKYNKEWYERNRERVKEYNKRRRARRRQWASARYAADPEVRRTRIEEVRQYRKRHPHARADRLLRQLGLPGTYESLLESQGG